MKAKSDILTPSSCRGQRSDPRIHVIQQPADATGSQLERAGEVTGLHQPVDRALGKTHQGDHLLQRKQFLTNFHVINKQSIAEIADLYPLFLIPW